MLDTSKTALTLSTEYFSYKGTFPNPHREYLDFLQTVLDTDFQKATTSLKNFLINPPAGSLYFEYTTPYDMPRIIGVECARYWSQAIGFGDPESCRQIDSVENDASKIAKPIEDELRNLITTRDLLTPYYYRFVDIIYRNVKTIEWTIIESDSDCDSTFTGTVS
jgi:hypothetical protein